MSYQLQAAASLIGLASASSGRPCHRARAGRRYLARRSTARRRQSAQGCGQRQPRWRGHALEAPQCAWARAESPVHRATCNVRRAACGVRRAAVRRCGGAAAVHGRTSGGTHLGAVARSSSSSSAAASLAARRLCMASAIAAARLHVGRRRCVGGACAVVGGRTSDRREPVRAVRTQRLITPTQANARRERRSAAQASERWRRRRDNDNRGCT